MKRLQLDKRYWLLAALLLIVPSPSRAHKPSDSYLSLRWDGELLEGQWDIALRDLEVALGLDADQNGAITWSELRSRHRAIADYALARLSVATEHGACALDPIQQLVDNHSDGAYSVLRFELDCRRPESGLVLDYQLFFDLDPSHRGLVRIETSGAVETAVLSPDRPRLEIRSSGRGAARQLAEYGREGVWHIWIGFDHILFLLTLLLPAVLWREGRRWRAASCWRPVLIDVAGIVTAFTAAHSITLSLAVLGWVALPSRWVESAIAATVLLVAANNLYPLVHGRRWLIAFGLGLIHGFGFASVLADLGLPGEALAVALLGFNLGVEVGQLAIVAVFLPLAFLLRDSWFYRRAVFTLGSLTVAALATLWLVERSLGLSLMPR